MKKTTAILLALTMFLSMTLVGCGNGGVTTQGDPSSSNITSSTGDGSHVETDDSGDDGIAANDQSPYATFFDHSEIEWYLTQKYGPDAPSHYRYYDLDDGEESFLIAIRTGEGDLPKAVIHAFNADIEDWYFYDNIIAESDSTENAGYTDEGDEIEKITLHYEGTPFYLYITYDAAGRVGKLMYVYNDNEYGQAQGYGYDDNDRVDGFISFRDSFYNAFFGVIDAENQAFDIWTYTYDENGKLVELSCVDGQKWTFGYDENGDRVKIEEENTWEEHAPTLTFERDENGRVTFAVVTEYGGDGEPYERAVNVSYLPGGMSAYNNSDE